MIRKFLRNRRIRKFREVIPRTTEAALFKDVGITLIDAEDKTLIGGIFLSSYANFPLYLDAAQIAGCRLIGREIVLPSENRIRIFLLSDEIAWYKYYQFYAIGIDEPACDANPELVSQVRQRLRTPKPMPVVEPFFKFSS